MTKNNTKNFKKSIVIMLMVLMGLMAAVPAFAAIINEVVIADELNLRAAPSTDSAIIGVLYKGDSVMVESPGRKQNGFVRVKVGSDPADNSLKGKEGWVLEKYLRVME